MVSKNEAGFFPSYALLPLLITQVILGPEINPCILPEIYFDFTEHILETVELQKINVAITWLAESLIIRDCV